MKDDESREKRWKDLYLRSVKLARARQLGMDYPRQTNATVRKKSAGVKEGGVNILFVCSRNQWRSPTAEKVFARYPGVSVRSAGTSPNARRHISVEDVRWADLILVMEEKHKSRLVAEFTRFALDKRIHVLDISDNYKYMDAELVQQLKDAVEPLLEVLAE
jgi:predicted protein tyrosine phosphatase